MTEAFKESFPFQSTPPSEERSDNLGPMEHDLRTGFNPRPPPKRGATRRSNLAPTRGAVSIHAPLRREERRKPESVVGVLLVFQSTPPSEERSDTSPCAMAGRPDGFNPRPPPKRGATAALISRLLSPKVSIHAPLRREERRPLEVGFNPRPPPKRGATGFVRRTP